MGEQLVRSSSKIWMNQKKKKKKKKKKVVNLVLGIFFTILFNGRQEKEGGGPFHMPKTATSRVDRIYR
jgi:hypothetical protein